MRRRELISLLGGAAAAWPLSARAQQHAMPVIGWLNAGPSHDPLFVNFTNVFRSALKDAGYVEGQNVEIDFRWAEGDYTRLPVLAAELVAKRVALIVAGSPPAALAAKAATATISIVFTVGADPVALGLIASFSHPGGNATGVNIVTDQLEAKRLGLLREVVPAARTIAVLLNPSSPSFEAQSKDVREGARTLGVDILILSAAAPADIDQAFLTLGERRPGALLVGSDPFLVSARKQLVGLAARQAIPSMYMDRETTAIGGLMSYSISLPDAYRQAAGYVSRILKGEKPSDLPVIRPTKFELVINLNTAKQLSLTLSPGLLSIADEVIE
jgi:putative tryptophan/tyrosine transport system substrate-binding protein